MYFLKFKVNDKFKLSRLYQYNNVLNDKKYVINESDLLPVM